MLLGQRGIDECRDPIGLQKLHDLLGDLIGGKETPLAAEVRLSRPSVRDLKGGHNAVVEYKCAMTFAEWGEKPWDTENAV